MVKQHMEQTGVQHMYDIMFRQIQLFDIIS